MHDPDLVVDHTHQASAHSVAKAVARLRISGWESGMVEK